MWDNLLFMVRIFRYQKAGHLLLHTQFACFGLIVLRYTQAAVTNIRRGNTCNKIIKMGSQTSNNVYGGEISITRGIFCPQIACVIVVLVARTQISI